MIKILTTLLLLYPLQVFSQTLTIQLPEPESDKGFYMIGIYMESDDFPEGPSITKKMNTANEFTNLIEFKNLKEGTYAASVYHDINGNGKLDRNLLGIPQEPFAFSNMKTMGMGPPKFGNASFQLSGNSNKITLTWLNK